jgi:signal transduction histidine kinase
MKNKLKDLIYIQENKPCNEQTVKGLFRSIIEPILEQNNEGMVLCRLEEKSKKDFQNIFKRLEYLKAKVYDFSDNPISNGFENILKEKKWDKTEFLYVLAERFSAVFIFDYEESEIKSFANFYTMYNSKSLSDSFEIINENSKINLKTYQDKFHPDRRENDILNSSIRKIIGSLNETNQEVLIAELEKENIQNSFELQSHLEFISTKSNYTAHEIRNQLSICNLYSNIIQKQIDKIKFNDEDVEKSFNNALTYIQKSLEISGNLLLDLKSIKNISFKEYYLKDVIENAIKLSRVYMNSKDIKIENKISEKIIVLIDENKFLTVVINLIKNAIESIEEKGEILLKANVEDEQVKINISNNGLVISKDIQDKIFKEGFTTKSTGSGLGLIICKKTLEEQFAQLKLIKSDEYKTEFEITLRSINK